MIVVAVMACVEAVVNVPLVPIVNEAIAVILTPVVVVPPFICKLLNVVNLEVGNVLFAVKITVPVPGVHVPLPAPIVIAPPMLRVPPRVISIIPCPNVPPSVKLPAVIEEPFTKVIVRSLAALVPPIAMFPETVSEEAPEKVSIPAVLVFGAIILLHAEFTFTVTVNPPPMQTISPAIGNVPVLVALRKLVVDHVESTFQLAEALE